MSAADSLPPGQLTGLTALSQSIGKPNASLPPVSEFAFSHVLLAVSSDIQEALDAISEICAKSRYSLADEYGAHMPPLGEITTPGGIANRSMRGRHGLLIRTAGLAESALSVVQEASSSNSSESGMRSAYGSLRNVLSGSKKGKRKAEKLPTENSKDTTSPETVTWAVRKDGKDSIIMIGRAKPSRVVSTDSALEQSMLSDQTLQPAKLQGVWRPWKRRRTSDDADMPPPTTASSALRSLLMTNRE